MEYSLILLAVLLVCSLWFMLNRCVRRTAGVASRYFLGGHLWEPISDFALPTCAYCRRNLRGWLSLKGLQCQICQIASHKLCVRKQGPCKAIAASEDQHHFVQACVPPTAKCRRCSTLCGTLSTDVSLQCLWCQETCHEKCRNFLTRQCSYGRSKKIVIPPTCVKLRPLRLLSLPEDSQPIVVVINPRSGGQAGTMALRAFYSLLNPVQVINVVKDGLAKLQHFVHMKGLRILCAGGDGTVSILLNWLYDKRLEETPPVGIFPLGTGNDLGIVLKWGKGLDSREAKHFDSMKEQAHYALKALCNSHLTYLDRWSVTFSSRRSEKTVVLCNYVGLGVDAQIVHQFHTLRESKPYLFQSRGGNRFIYSQLGGLEFFAGVCKNFSERVSVQCEGIRVRLPYLEGLLLLNISSYSGGVDLWGSADMDYSESSASEAGLSPKRAYHQFSKPSKQDGMVELVGFSSVLHLGQCQIGLSEPLKLAQGREFVIEVRGNGPVPIHIDGEPQAVRGPVVIRITRRDQVAMLANATEKHQKIARKVMDVLDWGMHTNVISKDQRTVLLKEFTRRSNI